MLEEELEQQRKRILRQQKEIKRLKRDDRNSNKKVPEMSDNNEIGSLNPESRTTRRSYMKLAALGGAGIGGGCLGYSLVDEDRSRPLGGSNGFHIENDGSIRGSITGNKNLTDIAGNNLWIDSSGVLNAEGSGTESLNDGSIVGLPGSVQDAIDRAAANGSGIVRLNPTRTYTQNSSFPWHVKSDVVLDFNGAILYGSGKHPDTDIIHVHPQGQIHNPKIDLWDEWNAYSSSTPYAGTVFTLDAKYGEYFADGTTVLGGWTQAVGSTGTWIYFGKNNASDRHINSISSIVLETNLRKPNDPATVGPNVIDTGIHLDSSGPEGYLNGVVIRSMSNGAKTMILQEGSEPNNGHIFNGVYQQPDGSDYFWHIKPDTFARGTVLRGKIWDVNRNTYPDGVAWLIESQFPETQDNAINVNGFSPSFVRNNSGQNQYITNLSTQETFVV